MLIFISRSGKMLIILTIFAALLAIAIVAFARRRSSTLLEEHTPPKHLPDASGFRSLFEPGPDELRAAGREQAAQLEAEKREQSKEVHDRRIAALNDLRESWAAAPTRGSTVELLYLASQSERGTVYAEITGEIIKLWKNGQIDNLSADDLSQLLESHYWLLPAQERTSGVIFSVKEEIAGLRRNNPEDK